MGHHVKGLTDLQVGDTWSFSLADVVTESHQAGVLVLYHDQNYYSKAGAAMLAVLSNLSVVHAPQQSSWDDLFHDTEVRLTGR